MEILLHKSLTESIIQCFYIVYHSLGYGILEKVYENAMLIELELQGLNAENQCPLEVNYNDYCIGKYYADIIIERKVIIEIKAKEHIIEADSYQLSTI